ncbi:MAG: hypothetical protein Q4A74_08670 [Cardiobacteriaceae bacterium]|nr:hypothetical protein [Cardiobacteriaceae bacterium]
MKKLLFILPCAIQLSACTSLLGEEEPIDQLSLRDYDIQQYESCQTIGQYNGYGQLLSEYEQCTPTFVCTLVSTGERIKCPRRSTASVMRDVEEEMRRLDAEECALFAGTVDEPAHCKTSP